MSKVSVIIPTFNNINGLSYLLNYFKDKPYQVIVVDNGKITQNLRLKAKQFIFLVQEKNLGFAKGINLGAKYANGEWMLILNDDIEFKIQNSKIKNQNEKNPIEFLVEYAEKNNLDAVTPILRNPDGTIENLGYKVLPYGRIKLVKEFASFRVNDLDGITAACLLIKTEVFKKLGGFDESFFAYLEDIDFFLRFKKAGFRFGIAPIEVLHRHMTTSKTMGSFKARQDMINWWRLYFKHPDKFKFNLQFLLERARNLSGYLKRLISNF
ncbi:MAG: glycosyltransferase [Patescibacteria group bacterium]|nr:glycosyltransferase [Patescibacteria group bacterium]